MAQQEDREKPEPTASRGDCSLLPSHRFIVAIDFGTKYSGYAFQQKDDEDEGVGEITPFVHWGGQAVYNNYKTPTCILLSSSGQFVAFGQEAIDQFIMIDEDELSGYKFFELFKMTLYKEVRTNGRLDLNFPLTARGGSTMPAVVVFSKALRHFRDHFFEMSKKRFGFPLEKEDALWVLTVPAIWDDSAKSFMREAAYQAELVARDDSNRLVIALEPEAAAIHCRSLDITGFQCVDKQRIVHPSIGQKYLVVDAGGGTVDITAHEIVSATEVREIEQATGGDFGGTYVDSKFMELLRKILGPKFIDEIEKRQAPELVKVMESFEQGKRKLSFKESVDGSPADSWLNVTLPFDLCDLYKQRSGKLPKERIEQLNNKNVKWIGGNMKINVAIAIGLFKPVITSIIKTLETLLSKDVLKDIKTIYLVGGFSDCPLLRQQVTKEFPNVRVLVPIDAGLAVVKGAVRFARNPYVIRERVMRYTYFTSYAPEFEEHLHPVKRKFYSNGRYFCSGCAHVFVRVSQSVPIDLTCEQEFFLIGRPPRMFSADLFVSTAIDVMYIDEAPNVVKIGEVKLNLPPSPDDMTKDRRCNMFVKFGLTEIKVKVVDVYSKEKIEVDVPFFNGSSSEA